MRSASTRASRAHEPRDKNPSPGRSLQACRGDRGEHRTSATIRSAPALRLFRPAATSLERAEWLDASDAMSCRMRECSGAASEWLANIFLVSPVLMSDRQRHIHSDVTRCCDGAPSRICGGVVRILEEPHGDKLRRQTGPCDRRRDIAAASAAPRCTTSIET